MVKSYGDERDLVLRRGLPSLGRGVVGWGVGGGAITGRLIDIGFKHHLSYRPWVRLSCVASGRLRYLFEPWILPLAVR